MRRTGVAYLNKVDSESVSDLRKTADSMPTWPNSDSVKKIDNVVVIKLGTKPGVD